LLSIDLVDPHKKFKDQIKKNDMKGLCQKCHSSNVDVTVVEGIPLCEVCSKKTE